MTGDQSQRSASWNLRTGLANVSILLGFFALAFIVAGGAAGDRLAPALAVAAGAVFGGAVYFSRPYPRLLRWMSWSAAALTVGGMIALGFVINAAA